MANRSGGKSNGKGSGGLGLRHTFSLFFLFCFSEIHIFPELNLLKIMFIFDRKLQCTHNLFIHI